MYIENPDLGYAHGGTRLYQMLGATYLGDGNSYTTGNVQSIAGEPGTFVSGLNYTYMYQQIPDNYVDYIGSNGGTILFRSQEDYGRVICYGGPSNSYRSIYSTLNLGALRDGANTKLQLVAKYMEYLLKTVIVEESKGSNPVGITIYPNPASNNVNFNLILNNNQRVKVNIYDPSGRIVRRLMDKELKSGYCEFYWNRCDDSGNSVSNGTYIFVIETSHKRIVKTVILIN